MTTITPLAFAGDAGGWLSTTEAAPYMGYHEATLRRMCAAQLIECLPRGNDRRKRYRLHRSVIQAWLDTHIQRARRRTA